MRSPDPEARQKNFVSHAPVRRNQVFAGKRDAVERVGARDVGIENSVAADHCAALVREHREGYLMCAGETGQHRGRIVTDRRQSQAALCERAGRMLQLDELRLAIGSPVGAAGESQQHPLTAHQALERVGAAVLILQFKRRSGLADRDPGGRTLVLGLDERL